MRREQYPIQTAAYMLSWSRQTLYRMEKAGEIVFLRRRGRTFVAAAEIERLTGQPIGGNRTTAGEPVGEPKPPRIKKVKLVPRVGA